MLQQNGLFCAVKVVALLLLATLAMPTPVSAQSDQFSRVRIQGPTDVFGDVLLVRDAGAIVMYGLAGSVPQGQITITAGAETFTRNASFAGKFPILDDNPIRITGDAEFATIEVNRAGTVVSGTVPLVIGGPEMLQALQDYQAEAQRVLSGEQDSVERGVPPHSLIEIIPENPADADSVGYVLLTQRLVGRGSSAVILDQFEGISRANGVSDTIRSVVPFSQIEVYSAPVDRLNPDRTKRLQVIDTTLFFNGAFVSNGAFVPISVNNANSRSVNGTKTLYLRILSFSENDENGRPPRIFLARIPNDVTAEFEGTPAVVNNNVQGVAGAPGIDGIATITGLADPYSIIIPYRTPPARIGDVNDNLLTSPVAANAAGEFTITIPGYAPEGGIWQPRQEAFLAVLDPLGNYSETPTQVPLDNQAVVFEGPTVSEENPGQFVATGTTEPGAIISVFGRQRDNAALSFAGAGQAGADGTFNIPLIPYFEYQITVIDQAGNQTTSTTPGDEGTIEPYNLIARSAFPDIILSGSAEANATVIVYAFPLNAVPETPTDSPTATLPPNAFFVTATNADAEGHFDARLPSSISRVIYVQAVDGLGNPSQYVRFVLEATGDTLVAFNITNVINNVITLPDVIEGIAVDQGTGDPVDGSGGTLFVTAYRSLVSDTAATFPFANELLFFGGVPIEPDGSFTIEVPDVDPIIGDFIREFYLVAYEQLPDGSIRVIGFDLIDGDDGLDRVGPQIGFTPLSADIILNEGGKNTDDILRIKRIFPAGTPFAGVNALPGDALPYIVIMADNNDDGILDLDTPAIQDYILTIQPLFIQQGIPFPGSVEINLGKNFWNAETQSVIGHSVVFIALIDAYGNISPNPLPVFLDVTTMDPNPALITVTGNSVFGGATRNGAGISGSVEPLSLVSLFENPDKSGFIAQTRADELGQFFFGGLTLTERDVYVFARDIAGNESNVVRLEVSSPVESAQPIILDGFGVIHTPSASVSAGIPVDAAVALAKVDDATGLFYLLFDDGYIAKLGLVGDVPVESQQTLTDGFFARDLEVVSSSPFGGYVLLGNGLIIPYGNVPFFGDIFTIQMGITSMGRLPLGDTGLLFDDLNGNGVWDTEDVNNNGILDVIVGIGGEIILNEDLNGNGIIDSEPILDPNLLGQGFGFDISRDLEIVKDASGNVKGYVILDGFGTMWAFGDDINAQNVRPEVTSGYATTDIFRKFELIVDGNGRIVDFITLNGLGQVFGLPGGPLGAGPATDTAIAGHLSVVLSSPFFDFDIARDIEGNPFDTNADGLIDYRDGFYILDGFGGVHAIGGAPRLQDLPFLGFDIARDLEFGTSRLR